MNKNRATRLLLVDDLDRANHLSQRLKKRFGNKTETCLMATKSLERFTPQYPLLLPTGGGAMVFCSRCKRDLLRIIIEKKQYCPSCGQCQADMNIEGLKLFLPPTGEGGRIDE